MPTVIVQQKHYENLAKSVLVMAVQGGMPHSFWDTDSKIRLACGTLGWTLDKGWSWACENEDIWRPV